MLREFERCHNAAKAIKKIVRNFKLHLITALQPEGLRNFTLVTRNLIRKDQVDLK